MKALIFGANGQDGYYLSEFCNKRNIEVIGVSRKGPWLHGDVVSPVFVENLIKSQRPDLVFHLAAASTTRHDVIYENHATIGTGTLNILESVRKHSPQSKVFFAGSGLQFVNKGHPISENDQFDSSSAYVATRNYSVYLARYFRSLGIRTYIGYLFHHESPLRGMNHVCQKIAQAVNNIHEGSDEILELGDISVRKEWTFAGDVVEGIMTLVAQDNIFEATIGSGRAYSIEQWLDTCFTLTKRDWTAHVKVNQSFKAEYSILVSNPVTINTLGWHASTSLEDLAKIMIKSTSCYADKN